MFSELQNYKSLNVLDPTMQPEWTAFNASYYEALANYPQVAGVNLNTLLNFTIMNQLSAPCGFTYNLWGGSLPATSQSATSSSAIQLLVNAASCERALTGRFADHC